MGSIPVRVMNKIPDLRIRDFFMQPVRGIEETRRPADRKKEPSGLFFSVWVPISRNVYRGCCNLQPVRESNSTATDRWQTTVSGLLFSAGVPPCRNVYCGCCWKTPSVFASQIHLPQRGRLLGREAKLCHLNNTAPAEPCASVHGFAGAVCHLIGCFPECKPRCPPARRPGRRLRRRSALRGRGSPTGLPWRADGRCGR